MATPPGKEAVVIVKAAAIDSVRSLLTDCETGLVESVTVICTGNVPAADGVPEITPVEAFIVTPDGSPVATHE